MRIRLLVLLLLWSAPLAQSVEPLRPLDGAELSIAIEKLGVLRSALYVAAHPDDENTAMISWLANDKLARTGYLSMTRGSGGQNLIGDETGPALGVIRTWELLAARDIDGGEQFFTNAIDFGYSKSPEETLSVWGREEILANVVHVIREFRPDVIITRFPREGFQTHGHHTASAVLANEAAALAGDVTSFPEQLEYLEPWTPKRVFWNAWQVPEELRAEVLDVPLGGYDPVRGLSWGELAALSRTMHKSQGFGVSGRRDQFTNMLLTTWGVPPAAPDPFDGIDSGWSRVTGDETLDNLFTAISESFNPRRPVASLPALLDARDRVAALDEGYWRDRKLEELDLVIRSIAGIWAEATVENELLLRNESVRAEVTVVTRAPVEVSLIEASSPFGTIEPHQRLEAGTASTVELPLEIPEDAPLTQPHWLEKRPTRGTYQLREPSLTGAAIARASIPVEITFEISGREMTFETPLVRRITDRVRGEVFVPAAVTPAVTLSANDALLIFPSKGTTRMLEVTLRNHGADVTGSLSIDLPGDWRAEPQSRDVTLGKGESRTVAMRLYPPADEGVFDAPIRFVAGDQVWTQAMQRIEYDHIPPTTIFTPAEARLVRTELETGGERIGYVTGSGDEVDDALERIGYEVVPISAAELGSFDLASIDTLVIGIRAFNTHPELSEAAPRLHEWTRRGGIVVVQYNTRGRRDETTIPSPVPLAIDRARVTVEESPVQLLAPEHVLLTTPNRIGLKDFDSWVQERGLYFPTEWDDGWEPLLRMADPGEEPTEGSLLVLEHGRGRWIYTGLSLFRQLPAGVPGAYRLLANLVSRPHDE